MKTGHVRMLLASIVVMFVIVGSLCASEMDDNIVTSTQNSYVFKTFLKDSDVKVECKEGVVTLSGTIVDEPSRLLAQETAARQVGVKSVTNDLKIKGEAPAEDSDTMIFAKVKVMLFTHRNVSMMTDVTVNKGFVILRGEASSKAEKQLTAEYVKDVDGVKDVKNEMTVVDSPKKEEQTMGDKIDDASITAQVKVALLFHRGTRVLKSEIETKDGVVTVSGTAKNAAEKDLVTKVVIDINGVTKVNNQLIVATPES